jgi:hypothetical protein
LLMSAGVITALPTSSSVLPLLSSLRQYLYFCTSKASKASRRLPLSSSHTSVCKFNEVLNQWQIRF